MPDESTFDAAANALAESANPGGSDPYGQGQGLTTPANQPEQGTPVEPAAPVDTGPASRDIDISQLPEEARLYLQAREREMTGDYTRKQQELATQRQEAEQAVAFYQALNSDPQFAAQVAQELQTALEQTGYLQNQPEPTPEVDEWGNPVEPDPYQAELEQIKSWMAEQQAAQEYYAAESHLNNQIAQIRSQHPDYTDEDIGNIVGLGYSTSGDLMKANEQYQAITQNTISRYMQSKGGVQTPSPLPNNQGTPAPEPLRGDAALRAAALERMRHELGE